MPDPLAYIAHINTATGVLHAINAVEQHCAAFLPGELDALKRRAHALGGAGLRDVPQKLETVQEAAL